MIAFNINKKLVEPNPDRDAARPLAQAKALEGAMLLAAALTLTRKNSILLPDRPVEPIRVAQALEPKELLRNWDAHDIQTLLVTLDELLTILEAVEQPPSYSVNALDRALQELVSVHCPPPQRESLLVGLVGLLEREPHIELRYCEVSQGYAWLLGHAAKLAERIILDTDAYNLTVQ